jgi:RimJ/RimL family protein N-acetyltransferase
MTFVRVTGQELNLIVDIESDPNLWQYSDCAVPSKEELTERHRKRIDSDNAYDFLVYGKSLDTPFGLAYIWGGAEPRREWQIGYTVLSQHQGKGYGFETAKKLLQYGFEELNAHRIVATCNAHNTASSRILQKIGMRREAVHIEKLYRNGEWTDQWFYAILDREYFDKKRHM